MNCSKAKVFLLSAFAAAAAFLRAAAAPVPEITVRTLSTSGDAAKISVDASFAAPGAHINTFTVSQGGRTLAEEFPEDVASVAGREFEVSTASPLDVSAGACEGETCFMPETVRFFWNAASGAFEQTPPVENPAAAPAAAAVSAPAPSGIPAPLRKTMGRMDASQFLSWLRGGEPDDWSGASFAAMALFALLFGFLMNLSPCVLPMIPVNLAIIGAGARAIEKKGVKRSDATMRGLAYGLGITIAYGTLGLLAAFAGVAFGTIQANPWFNAAMAAVFFVLGLSLLDLFFIDFARLSSGGGSKKGSFAAAFAAGALSAVLAGACVAPFLIALLLYTAKNVAAGNPAAAALPFIFGIGMALPWPAAGAGISFLPKPGTWMNWVKKAFAVFILALAAHYGKLAFDAWTAKTESVTPRDFPEAFAKASAQAAAEDKKVLVDCWATWCGNCRWMESNVFTDSQVRDELEKNYVLLRLQAERMEELRALPGFGDIDGLPAFIVFPPASGADAQGK